MLDLRTDIPLKQDCVEAIQDKFAQIRDLLTECEQIVKLCIDSKEKILLTRAEAAEYLRCKPNHIPRSIPRFRMECDLRFREADLKAFVDSKMKALK